MNAVHVATVVGIMVAAWFLHRSDWKRKPLGYFTEPLESRNWSRYELSIRELQKRGQDVSQYLPRVVSLLVADSKLKRAMGHRVIRNCFPDIAREIDGYKFSADADACRAKVAPLLTRFPDEVTAA